MMDLFIIGTIGWWVITLGFIALCVFSVDRVSWGWSTICLVLYIFFLQYMGKVDLFGLALNKPTTICIDILVYFIVGILWSFIKWWLYLKKIVKKIKEEKEQTENKYKDRVSAVPEQCKKLDEEKQREWENILQRLNLEKPSLNENKSRISLWIVYWPVSLLWSLMDDFVKKIANEIVDRFKKIYQTMIDKIFKEVGL